MILDELASGKRENAFYVKSNVLQGEEFRDERFGMPRKVYVYEWDEEGKKHIGHLVDAAQYYKEF